MPITGCVVGVRVGADRGTGPDTPRPLNLQGPTLRRACPAIRYALAGRGSSSFAQERGELVYVHDDVRDQVSDDAQNVRETLPDHKIDGVLVTGDLAYSGPLEEYAAAGKFLDRLKGTAYPALRGIHSSCSPQNASIRVVDG